MFCVFKSKNKIESGSGVVTFEKKQALSL